jgi:Predicted membrane protein
MKQQQGGIYMSVKSHAKTVRLVQLAVLSAIIVLMAVTPLGYLKAGVISISFLAIPVVIGGIVCGPLYGGILGAVFGLTSFVQCFGADAFGTALMEINPVATFIMCIVPRILIGVFAGLVFKALIKTKMPKAAVFSISSLIGALTNTIFFIGLLFVFFYNSDYISNLRGSMNLLAFCNSICRNKRSY